MPSIAENLTTWAGKAAGVNVSFADGALNVDLTPAQTERAQSFVRAIISPSKDKSTGKSKFKLKQTFQIIGEPVLEVYGFYIALGLGGLLALGIVAGRLTMRKRKER